MVICPVCGASNPEGSAFCMVCGSRLKSVNVPANVLKKYNIYADRGSIEFRNEENVSEITVKKSGFMSKEHLILEGNTIVGKIIEDKVYDASGNTVLADINGTTTIQVSSYWIRDTAGNVVAKTVSEEARGHFLDSLNYLIYNIVDGEETIARIEPRTSMINVKFLHLRYHLYLYSNKLQPVMLAALIYAIKRGDDKREDLSTYGGGAPFGP